MNQRFGNDAGKHSDEHKPNARLKLISPVFYSPRHEKWILLTAKRKCVPIETNGDMVGRIEAEYAAQKKEVGRQAPKCKKFLDEPLTDYLKSEFGVETRLDFNRNFELDGHLLDAMLKTDHRHYSMARPEENDYRAHANGKPVKVFTTPAGEKHEYVEEIRDWPPYQPFVNGPLEPNIIVDGVPPYAVATMLNLAQIREGDAVALIDTRSAYPIRLARELAGKEGNVAGTQTDFRIRDKLEDSMKMAGDRELGGFWVWEGTWEGIQLANVMIFFSSLPCVPQSAMDRLTDGGRLILPLRLRTRHNGPRDEDAPFVLPNATAQLVVVEKKTGKDGTPLTIQYDSIFYFKCPPMINAEESLENWAAWEKR